MSSFKNWVYDPKNEQLILWGLVSLAVAVAFSLLTRSSWSVVVVISLFCFTVLMRSSKWPVFMTWIKANAPIFWRWLRETASELWVWLKANFPVFWRGFKRMGRRIYYHFLIPAFRRMWALYIKLTKKHPVFFGLFFPGAVMVGVALLLYWMGMSNQNNGGVTLILGLIGGLLVAVAGIYGFCLIMGWIYPLKKRP